MLKTTKMTATTKNPMIIIATMADTLTTIRPIKHKFYGIIKLLH